MYFGSVRRFCSGQVYVPSLGGCRVRLEAECEGENASLLPVGRPVLVIAMVKRASMLPPFIEEYVARSIMVLSTPSFIPFMFSEK